MRMCMLDNTSTRRGGLRDFFTSSRFGAEPEPRAPVSTSLVLFAILYAIRLKQTINQLETALGDFEERIADIERLLSAART